MHAESAKVTRISTNDVAPAHRLDYGNSLVSSSLTPSVLSTQAPLEFVLEMASLELPSIGVIAFRGSPQRFTRARPEIRRTNQHCFNLLLISSGVWQVTSVHRAQLGTADLIFYDSRTPIEISVLRSWGDINLRLSEQFVRDWLPNPASLSGRRIAHDSRWGRLLASYVAQLSPEFMAQAPLPQSVLVDQLGALLALTAAEFSGGRTGTASAERSLLDPIHDLIRQRCAEAYLEAASIAASLNISKRTLHRALAAHGETFGEILMLERVELASRMLQSRIFDRLTTAEIGRRAGFVDASHFTKVVRARTGLTPLQMRKGCTVGP